MNIYSIGKHATIALALSSANISAALAQEENAKEEGNRNVMLNAASANGPREIQIGRPMSTYWKTDCL